MKKFKKFKSDLLWEKENANYESLDSDDSIDISKKVNKSNFHRSTQMDRMDLSESNIKKKERIQKELSKVYLTNHSNSSSGPNHQKQNSKSLPRDVKIHIFNQSDVKPLHPSFKNQEKDQGREKEPNLSRFGKKKMPEQVERTNHHFKTPSHRNFLAKPVDAKQEKKRFSYSLQKSKKSGSKKMYLTNKNNNNKQKRFKDDEDEEQFKFY